MFAFSRPAWVRRLVHGPCQGTYDHLYEMHERLEDQYERLEGDYERLAASAYRADEALSESAQAHDEAEEALSEARERIEDLEQELARTRAGADQVRAANTAALALFRRPLTIGQGHADPLVAAEKHQVMIWFGLIELASRMARGGYAHSSERLRALAEIHRQRVTEALTALSGPEHTVELLARLEHLAVLPLEEAVT